MKLKLEDLYPSLKSVTILLVLFVVVPALTAAFFPSLQRTAGPISDFLDNPFVLLLAAVLMLVGLVLRLVREYRANPDLYGGPTLLRWVVLPSMFIAFAWFGTQKPRRPPERPGGPSI